MQAIECRGFSSRWLYLVFTGRASVKATSRSRYGEYDLQTLLALWGKLTKHTRPLGSASGGMGPKWSPGTVTMMRPLLAFARPLRTALEEGCLLPAFMVHHSADGTSDTCQRLRLNADVLSCHCWVSFAELSCRHQASSARERRRAQPAVTWRPAAWSRGRRGARCAGPRCRGATRWRCPGGRRPPPRR